MIERERVERDAAAEVAHRRLAVGAAEGLGEGGMALRQRPPQPPPDGGAALVPEDRLPAADLLLEPLAAPRNA